LTGYGEAIGKRQFQNQVWQLAQRLPEHAYAFNLCEGRYSFLLAFVAVMLRGQINLLPPSRAERVIEQISSDYRDCYRVTDELINKLISDAGKNQAPAERELSMDTDEVAAILFTSGTTGKPTAHAKRWGELVKGMSLLQQQLGLVEAGEGTVVATVPPQHMYGLETSVVLPAVAGFALFDGSPFFPEDIRRALESMPEKRILVTTPLHLRSCIESDLQWPECSVVLSATAPLSKELATAAEEAFNAEVFEIYGSTETGAMAGRRTAQEDGWRLFPSLELSQENGKVYVKGEHLGAVALSDSIKLRKDGSFSLLGRCSDMVKIAGKRAALGDLNHKLNQISGVQDGVFVVPEGSERDVRRLAALVVAPELSKADILSALADHCDPVFLPRPLYLVEQLPRNETGKLPQSAVQQLLKERGGRGQ